MRRLPRITLPQRVLDALETYQRELDHAVKAERKKKRPATREVIDAAWSSRLPNTALKAVRVALDATASGRQRCMYCEDSRAEDIEHFRPKASHPERAFDWLNLLKVCPPVATDRRTMTSTRSSSTRPRMTRSITSCSRFARGDTSRARTAHAVE